MLTRRFGLLFVVSWLCSLPALGQIDELGPPIGLHEATAGSLLFCTDHPGAYLPAPALDTDVGFQITGMIARVRVTQKFHNPTEVWVEGVYVFPLPETAAVGRMRLRVGERVIEGRIKEREEAKQIYEAAKSEGKKASLVEQERPNIFTTSVANIGPDEVVEVEIEYQQDLRYENGRFSLRYPMVVGPRYVPGNVQVAGFLGNGWGHNTDQVPDAERITPPVHLGGESSINPVSLHVELDTGLPLKRLESRSHSLRTVSQDPGRLALALEDGKVPADRDFLLEWEIEPSAAPRAALFTQEKGDHRYVLLMVVPPEDEVGHASRLPRETVFIIDTSGSMAGESMPQARKALLLALDRLHPEDTFNIIEFDSSARRLFETSRPANGDAVTGAKRWVRELRADGGTEMLSALSLALPAESYDERVRQIIFITDGSVGNEKQLFDTIRTNLGKSRLFTVGIGSAPNSYFMRKAAQFGRGTFTYIVELDDVQRKMTALFQKLESPMMSDIQLQWSHPEVETWPNPIPDLYAGEPVLVAARLSGTFGRLGEVEVSGLRPGGPWNVQLSLEGGAVESGVDRLWARRKIAALMDGLVEGVSEEIVKEAVVKLGLHHQLVSKYTSLVAVDVTPTAPVGERPVTRPLPVNLPAGWSAEHVFGSLPRGATPAPLYLLLGLLTSGVAWIVRLRRRDDR